MIESMSGKKIGILGGTFNPIHNAHLRLAKKSLEFCDLSKVLILPSGCSYLKDQSLIASKTDRINMVLLAIRDYKGFELSTLETDKEGNSYTYETLHDLKSSNPEDELFFIIGADTLFNIDSWMKPEEIFRLSKIIAARRDEHSDEALNERIDFLREKYGAQIILIDSPKIDISSSEIRARIKDHLDATDMLPAEVYEYIKTKGLYL